MFIARWTFYTTTSFLLAAALVTIGGSEWQLSFDDWSPFQIMGDCAAIAFLMSFSQYFLLRKYLTNPLQWIHATVFGATISAFLIALTNFLWIDVNWVPGQFDPMTGLLFTSLVMGAYQSRVLFSNNSKRGAWILATFFSVAVAIRISPWTGIVAAPLAFAYISSLAMSRLLKGKRKLHPSRSRLVADLKKTATGIALGVAAYLLMPIVTDWTLRLFANETAAKIAVTTSFVVVLAGLAATATAIRYVSLKRI